MATEKCLYAFDYVDLKDREYVKKHSKKRYLGDIDGKHCHRSRPSTATVVHSLVSLNFPETRAINTTTAGGIISEQRKQITKTYQKTQWKETLNKWSRPSTATEKRTETPVAVEERPHTSASVSIPNGSTQLQMNTQNLRPFSTGAIRRPSRKPPQASGFMWVRMKRNSNSSSGRSQFKRITDEIRLQWDEEKKRDQQGTHRRGKSQSPRNCDTSAKQWLRFAAGGAEPDLDEGEQAGCGSRVVEAFTGETNAEYYNIDGKVGADVATQLRIGNKIRIGVNGTVHTDSLRVHKWRKEVEKAESTASDDSFSSTDSDLFKLSNRRRRSNLALAVPLCWEDQINRPDVRVKEAKEKPTPTAKRTVSERHPVVFEKLVEDGARLKTGPKLETYRLSHRTKTKRNLDGTDSLSNRITVITVDQIQEDRDSLCSLDYEEILQRSLEAGKCIDEEPPMLLPQPEDSKKMPERTLGSPVKLRSKPKKELIVKKTLTPRSSPQQSLASDAGLVTRSMTPKSRFVHLTSPVPSSPSIVSGRPHTGSQHSERVQSSYGRGYTFSQSPTPRNVNSPYPNLVKPGQLPRSGVSSINPGTQEGEHEYIKISYPILSGSEQTQSQMDNMVAISRVGEQNVIGDFQDESDESLGQNPSEASFSTMDSIYVEDRQTDINDHPLDDLTPPPSCSCSPETKRVVSAALSQSYLDSANFVDIPTADMNMSLSDLNSMSDADPLAFYSPFRGSLCSDIGAADLMPEWDIQVGSDSAQNHESLPSNFNASESDNVYTKDNTEVGLASASSTPTTSSRHTSLGHKEQDDLGHIINQVHELELAQSEFKPPGQQQKTASEKKPNRTVTFADAIQTPFTPNCTPESTPRDPADLETDRLDVESNNSQEVEQISPRASLT